MAARSAVDDAPGGQCSARPSEVDSEQVEEIVTQVLRTLDGDITMADIKVYHELEELARFIDSARAEIAALCPHEIKSEHIPTATDELDAIVGATEEATHAIMEAAERIEGAAETLEAGPAEILSEAVTAIYEACSFQDITGQRVTKVVKALQQIEVKVDALVTAFGDDLRRHRKETPVADNEGAEPSPPDPVEEGDELSLLNGPQSSGEGQTQEEIDALFASLD